MKTYPKIDTLFERGPDFTVTNILRRPEFGLFNEWIIQEKIDGTNIRLGCTQIADSDFPIFIQEIGGRTDNAQLPKPLLTELAQLQTDISDKVEELMNYHGISSYTLFGEGYGPGIQKGGKYRSNPGFILFDILVDDKNWLGEDAITEAATHLGIDRVSTYTVGSLEDAVSLVRGGDLESIIAAEKDFEAEGVVAKTSVPLYNNRGQRVMWKLKGRDYRAGKR